MINELGPRRDEFDEAELSLRQDIEAAIIQASDCVNDSTEWWAPEEKGPRLIETLIGMIVIAANEYRKRLDQTEELLIYKRAMDSMAAQMVHPKMTGLEMAKMQLGDKP